MTTHTNYSSFKVERSREETIKKTKAYINYKTYMGNFDRNRKSLEIEGILYSPFERSLSVTSPTEDFEGFLRKFTFTLKVIINNI